MSRITPAIDTRLFNALQPSVSVGNVGQLTADLMISSLSAVRVGKHDWHARVEGGRSVTGRSVCVRLFEDKGGAACSWHGGFRRRCALDGVRR